jgi:hypothetical protein
MVDNPVSHERVVDDATAPVERRRQKRPRRKAQAERKLHGGVVSEGDALADDALAPLGDPLGPAGLVDAAAAAAREASRLELQDRLAAHLARGRPRVVLTDNLATMVSIKRGDGVVTFRVHLMFLVAPPPVVRALARYAERQDRAAARLLRAWVDRHEKLIRRRDAPRPMTLDTQGKHHDLQVVFDRLNALYFAGSIRARITWGPRTRRRRKRDTIKLGSYTFEDELIRIHPVLDAADVPDFFVEWIVYHEMLHEVHDMPLVDGRRVYHTPEFRRAEAEFERYAEAILWERTHLQKLLER